jgi:hypothetical protein
MNVPRSYRASLTHLSAASRAAAGTPATETDPAALAEYERLLRQLANTPIPRDAGQPFKPSDKPSEPAARLQMGSRIERL